MPRLLCFGASLPIGSSFFSDTSGDDEQRHHARGLGAFDFITKPVDFYHLKAQLRRLLGAPTDNLRAP